MKRDELKIEFRAVPYAMDSHVLEYRISPEQDLTYYKTISLFWDKVKFKIKRKYSTSWCRLEPFNCFAISEYYDINYYIHYCPIFCRTKEELNWYKENFDTIGKFENYIKNAEQIEINEYKIRRQQYLENRKTFY